MSEGERCEWPVAWVCPDPECGREWEGPGRCRMHSHGKEKPALRPYAIPPHIHGAARELQKCAGILQLAAPPDAVTRAVEALARFAYYDDSPAHLDFVRHGQRPTRPKDSPPMNEERS